MHGSISGLMSQTGLHRIEMISAQHSSNNGKNQVTKKSFKKGKKILSRFKLSS